MNPKLFSCASLEEKLLRKLRPNAAKVEVVQLGGFTQLKPRTQRGGAEELAGEIDDIMRG